MVGGQYVPDRGDIVWLSFSPQAGHEQSGHRPALVLSQKRYNQVTRLALFCPITSQVKGYPFEVPLPQTSPINGVVLSDQVRSLDWQARGAQFAAKAPTRMLQKVLQKLAVLL